MSGEATIIEVDQLVTEFGPQRIHDRLSFSITRGEKVALIGGSGTGKSVLLREILGLHAPTAGSARLFGTRLGFASQSEERSLRKRFGVLFQSGALFSALTCGENIATPLREQLGFSGAALEQLVQLRLGLVGLSPDVAQKMPSELSGGMVKRVALARALALEPEVLFLDEPTSGLDPISARSFDKLVRTLHESLALTLFIVTHDLDSLFCIAPRIIVLGKGHVLADGPIAAVARDENEWIRTYFNSRYHEEQADSE